MSTLQPILMFTTHNASLRLVHDRLVFRNSDDLLLWRSRPDEAVLLLALLFDVIARQRCGRVYHTLYLAAQLIDCSNGVDVVEFAISGVKGPAMRLFGNEVDAIRQQLTTVYGKEELDRQLHICRGRSLQKQPLEESHE